MNHAIGRYLLIFWTCGIALAQNTTCIARPGVNSPILNPLDLTATNGELKVALSLRSQQFLEQPLKVCYIYENGSTAVEAPTLRLNPGDLLEVTLANRLTYPPQAAPPTNLNFDGLNIPQDTSTAIRTTDPPFDYKIQIPKDNPPGLYWYHPQLLGSSTLQLNGGASGAIVVNGIEKVKPEVAGLPERILIVRQHFDEPDDWPPGEYRLTLNFHWSFFPHLPSSLIRMKPGVKEFWRVLNATSQAFLALQEVFGDAPQTMKLIALDGVPLTRNVDLRTVKLPPGGRAEFIVTAPAAGQEARLMHAEYETGPTGMENPVQEMARIIATPDAEEPPPVSAGPSPHMQTPPAAHLATVRKLYFAEATNGTNGPTKFFLTVEGQDPKLFDPSDPPAIVTKVGSVEDWIISNRSGESHAFHLHGFHFLYNSEQRDTVTLPAWEGDGPYPQVRLRLDFREARTAGTYLFHCDISHHGEAGMMGKLQVNP